MARLYVWLFRVILLSIRMSDLKKGLFFGFLALGVVGCSEPEPHVIDMNEVAAEAGLSEDDYEVQDNGAIKIKAPDATANSDDNQPEAAQGDNWQYIVNNGIRTADKYAVDNNPAATFVGNDVQANLVEQISGEYEGEYLLTVLNDSPDNVSYSQLRPLFDINSSSDNLDDEGQLWEVTTAKYNGREF